MLPGADLVFLAVPALVWCVWRSWSRVSRTQLLVRCVLVVYLFGVVGVTMFPLPVVPSEISIRRDWVRTTPGYPSLHYNLVPGASIGNAISDALQSHRDVGGSLASSLWLLLAPFLGNVAMLLPLGFLLPLLSARWRRWWRTAALVAATTVTIEVAQLLGSLAYGFPYKTFDVDDIWLNFLGGVIGYGLYKLLALVLRDRVKAESSGSPGGTAAA